MGIHQPVHAFPLEPGRRKCLDQAGRSAFRRDADMLLTGVRHLSKPFEDLTATLGSSFVVPTMTKAQPRFANVYDVSNASMFRFYAKLGLDRPGANGGVLHMDKTPHRIDRDIAIAR